MSQPPGSQFGSPTGSPAGIPPTGPGGMPPKTGGNKTVKILLIVGGVLIVLSLICCGGCYGCFAVLGNAVADQVKAKYQDHPDIVEHIGSDAEFDWDVMASGEESNKNPGRQKQVFNVSGSKGSGKVIVEQTPGGIGNGILRTDDGTEYPLD